ncbi:MAG: zinc-dependent metalloprotease, partial [Myxococcales bacterium]|nr:zinc-dependent metalloprotease [Myxococcales bacterium]
FIGETGKLERVRWEIQENLLVAYRSYPLVRGSEAPSTDVAFDGKENPLAAWPIEAHVDILREYNSATGEQGNVIVEDTSDRLWHERDYIRVDWSQNQIVNFDFIAPMAQVTQAAYFVQEEQGKDPAYAADAFYREETDGHLNYFDVLGKLFVEPDIDGCIYTWWGFAAEDCASAEIEVRTSFSKLPARSTYEPFHYSDQLMSRFGYFRSEYFTYDEQRGITDAGRRYLINRHDIFERSVDDDGNPIPLPERTVRSVPYYLSAAFPDDPLLQDAAVATMAQWNTALKDGLAAAGVTVGADPFVLCHTPVVEGDPDACGKAGFAPRMGDLRYSALHWVAPDTLEGLLGYGPSAADPITGEIISGKAYIYGAAVSTWATYAVDVLRYFNEKLKLGQLVRGEQFQEEVAARLTGRDHIARPSSRLDRVPIDRPMHRERRPTRPQVDRDALRPFDADAVQRRLDTARANGASGMLLGEEVRRGLAGASGKRWEALSDDERDRLDPTRVLNPIAIKKHMARRATARARTADMPDMIAPDIAGLAQKYLEREDYENVWRELRAEIFAATAEHEVGHTLGLRHNFQGSYDSLNYFDQYWNLREETLIDAQTVGDIYRLTDLTPTQDAGLMRQKQYSSIMDYGYSWHNDNNGLGKYDAAAIVFGYTSGSYVANPDRCATYPHEIVGSRCLANQPGLVPVFKKHSADLGRAGQILTQTEDGFSYDDSGLPSITALERYHYTTIARAFPSLDDLSDAGREYMPYPEYLEEKEANPTDRPVRVPFLFCSDEWEGGLVSCHVFDQGADPFEIARSHIDDYRAYYPFVNYRRDRPFFDIWYPLIDYYYYDFLPLSDIFQSWYVAPYGFDPLFDRVYDLAINSGFNLLAEVMATPPYGRWCQGTNGSLIHLSEEPELQGNERPDPECETGETLYMEPGVGRRRFSIYDDQAGYNFPFKPLEAGHYWATLAAVWAITDPDAYILGVDGDAGTYAISFYDWFPEEFEGLMDDLLAKNYPTFAPVAVPTGETSPQGFPTLSLRYNPPAPLYDVASGGYFDPETGASSGPFRGGPVGLCEPCEANADCAGFTGFLGGSYCQPLGDDQVCLRDCTNGGDTCPDGTVCQAGNCVPSDGDCAPFIGACDGEHPFGACDVGTCVDNECLDPAARPLVETDPTFAMATDILWYGFIFTTASYSTRFNDQLNVFRPGSDAEVQLEDPQAAERYVFTDPLSGVAYAAIQPRCEAVAGGSAGLCSPCTEDADCVGHTGFLGGTYCQPIVEDGDTFCLQDCTDDPSLCGAGEECDDIGNCVPTNGACGLPKLCSQSFPLGSCPDGFTCYQGECREPFTPTAHCQYQVDRDTGGVQLIKKAQELADNYDRAMRAWYEFDADADPEEDDRLASLYFRARYRLTNHVDLIETLIASYAIFGRVY